jgi:formyltetrahydrofolate deformylase
MVSKLGHCLNDLIFRRRAGRLGAELVGVVSNHTDLRPTAEAATLPFFHVPVTPETKQQAERHLIDLVEEQHVDLVVLARYMQILSDETCTALYGRAINIHHSFLPGSKGARPYHQAFDRGVKLVGATAHYVTPELDEGPIIEQEVIRNRPHLRPARAGDGRSRRRSVGAVPGGSMALRPTSPAQRSQHRRLPLDRRSEPSPVASPGDRLRPARRP